MEQHFVNSDNHSNSTSRTSSLATLVRPDSPTISVHSLRFPKPEGNQQLARWVSNSLPDIRHNPTMSEDGLGESGYEIVSNADAQEDQVATSQPVRSSRVSHTDAANTLYNEGQDAISESVSSLECSRPEDVHSVNASSDEYNTDSENEGEQEDNHQSSPSSTQYANRALGNPSIRPNSASLEYTRTPDASMASPRIEFHEDVGNMDKISVKHTIQDFDEEQSAKIVAGLCIHETPKRVAATIRQTMSHGCLSSQQALRVMYTGDPGVLPRIVHKLSSAICASASTTGFSSASHRNSYHIVPVSSFGSTGAPDIHLMESSRFQIQPEHCISAQEVSNAEETRPEDAVYCITTDHNRTYKSIPSHHKGFVVHPKWSLPHIAVFYLTECDDPNAQRTRDIAWQFMSRHGVPSIFICDHQSFNELPTGKWSDNIDQHAVHMCVESRDIDTPVAPVRLPIDLDSFLTIDARQMNRNLTYLTGLSELVDESDDERESASSAGAITPMSDDTDNVTDSLQRRKASCKGRWAEAIGFARKALTETKQWRVSLAMTLLAGIVVIIGAAFMTPGQGVANQTSLISTIAVSAILPNLPAAAMSTSTTTVTSTKTVSLRHAEGPTSSLASALSFAGYLSDRVSTAVFEPEATHAVCSVEVQNDKELLVRMPTDKKAAWFSKGAINFKLLRGQVPIKSPKLSLVDDGVLLELDKVDAYGVMNISITTTKRPKINETFQVNFGRGVVVDTLEAGVQALQELVGKVGNTFAEATHMVDVAVAGAEQKIRAEAGMLASDIKAASLAGQQAAHKAKQMLGLGRLTTAIQDARGKVAERVATRKEDAELTVLKAQIASRLWWLKVRGKKDEYADYQNKASQYLKQKYIDVTQAREQKYLGTRGEGSYGCHGRRKSRTGRPTSQTNPPGKAAGTDGGWRKVLGLR